MPTASTFPDHEGHNTTDKPRESTGLSQINGPTPIAPRLPNDSVSVESAAVGYVRTVVPLPQYVLDYLQVNQSNEQDLFFKMNEILPGLIGYLPRWEMSPMTQQPQATGELLFTRHVLGSDEVISILASSSEDLFSALQAIRTIDEFLIEKGVRSILLPEQIDVIGESIRVVFIPPPSQVPRPPAEVRIFHLDQLREQLEARWDPQTQLLPHR